MIVQNGPIKAKLDQIFGQIWTNIGPGGPNFEDLGPQLFFNGKKSPLVQI